MPFSHFQRIHAAFTISLAAQIHSLDENLRPEYSQQQWLLRRSNINGPSNSLLHNFQDYLLLASPVRLACAIVR